MSGLTNPYESDANRAAVFELGYLAGFHDPAGDDPDLLPFAPELLDVYVEGADAGRQAAHVPPQANPAMAWIPKSALKPDGEGSFDEAIEHLTTYTLFRLLEEITGKAAFGLIDVVWTAVNIPGDVMITSPKPLEDDFSEDFDAPHSDSVSYIAACPRTDHMGGGDQEPSSWLGQPHHDFKDALRDAMHHSHREAVIFRCNTQVGTCGAVWLATEPG